MSDDGMASRLGSIVSDYWGSIEMLHGHVELTGHGVSNRCYLLEQPHVMR